MNEALALTDQKRREQVRKETKVGKETEEILESLKITGFSGVITFTNEENYAWLDLNEGELVGFWYSGGHEIESIDGFVSVNAEEKFEIEIFERDATQNLIEEQESKSEPDYTGIAESIADVLAGFSEKRAFYDVVREKFEEKDGLRVAGKEIIVDGVDLGEHSVYNDESELIFHLFYEAMEEKAKLIPVPKILDKAEDEIKEIEGGEEFLEIAVIE